MKWFVASFLLCATMASQAIYMLKVQVPCQVELQEKLVGFYQGKPINFEKQWALLPEEKTGFTFSIVITPEVGFVADGNNIRYLHRYEEQPFCWYDVTLRTSVPNTEHQWHIKQLSQDEAPEKLPDHAIIVLLDPTLVDSLKTTPRSPCIDQTSLSRMIPLPTIVLKDSLTTEQLTEACREAQLASLELRTVHQQQPSAVIKEELSVITLCEKGRSC